MKDIASKHPTTNRLQLCNREDVKGAVNGAWWPKSSDLRTELPDLIAVFCLWIGPVRRVVYDPSRWSPAPPRIIRGNVIISLDPYRLVAGDTIFLVGTHARDAVLFVVPPVSDVSDADRVLHAVSDATQPMSAAVLRRLLSADGNAVDTDNPLHAWSNQKTVPSLPVRSALP